MQNQDIFKFSQINFQNSTGTWKKIHELLNNKPNQHDDININENGATICNHKLVPNKFNNYLLNIAQNFLRKLGENDNNFQDYLKDLNIHSFLFKQTTPAEVQQLLNNLNIRKANDIYGILPQLVKPSSEHIKNVCHWYLRLLLMEVFFLTN